MVWVVTDVFVHVYGTLGTSFLTTSIRETLELAYIGGYSLLPYQEELCLWVLSSGTYIQRLQRMLLDVV